MKVHDTRLAGVKHIELDVYRDERGDFLESYQAGRYANLLGAHRFVQDNCSHSRRGVLRGLHYQVRQPQGKLLRVVLGRIFDVVVDLRPDSSTFGLWDGKVLAHDDHLQLWIPPGFAHGFYVLSDNAIVEYKCTELYQPHDEACLIWNDPDLAIAWPEGEKLLSDKDRQGASLAQLRRKGRLPGSRGI